MSYSYLTIDVSSFYPNLLLAPAGDVTVTKKNIYVCYSTVLSIIYRL